MADKLTAEARAELRRTAATHHWVGAAELALSASQARTGDLRAAVTVKVDTKVHLVDVYCARCKSTYQACAHTECPARDAQRNEHLRGGPIGERRRQGREAPFPPPAVRPPYIGPPQPRPRPVPRPMPGPVPRPVPRPAQLPTARPVPAVAGPPARQSHGSAAVPIRPPLTSAPASARTPRRRRPVPAGQLDLFNPEERKSA